MVSDGYEEKEDERCNFNWYFIGDFVFFVYWCDYEICQKLRGA